MTGKVIVNICATHKNDSESQILKYTYEGLCRKTENATIIMYDSDSEDKQVVSKEKNIINIKEDSVEYTRRGDATVRFVFKENKRTKVSYVTVYGGYNMDIFTKSVLLKKEGACIALDINYDLLDSKGDISDETYKLDEIISSVMMNIEIKKDGTAY